MLLPICNAAAAPVPCPSTWNAFTLKWSTTALACFFAEARGGRVQEEHLRSEGVAQKGGSGRVMGAEWGL